MQIEYLLLNLVVISGPLILSFDRRVHFYTHWPSVFRAIPIVMAPFIVWDAVVSGRHWWFNEAYTMSWSFFDLPPGEWLFFITVPYATLFIWEVLLAYFRNGSLNGARYWEFITGSVLLAVAGFSLLTGREYTLIVALVSILTLILDRWLGTGILRQRLVIAFTFMLVLLMLIFNGYLTARPVVLYDARYQLDWRVITIPIEDFFYGFCLVFLNIIVHEKWKARLHGKV